MFCVTGNLSLVLLSIGMKNSWVQKCTAEASISYSGTCLSRAFTHTTPDRIISHGPDVATHFPAAVLYYPYFLKNNSSTVNGPTHMCCVRNHNHVYFFAFFEDVWYV